MAERPARSECLCVHVCFSLLMHPPVVDVPPCERVNPLNLNWAGVPAHHSVSSVQFFPPRLPPVETQTVG